MKNIVPIIIGCVLVAGGIFIGTNLNSNKAAQQESSEAAARSAANAATAAATPVDGAKASSNKRESAWAQLAEKYGDGRTKLSKKVTEDMSKLLTDAVDLADMGAKLAGSDSAKAMASKQLSDTLARQLKLDASQTEKVGPIVEARIDERMTAVNELASAMKEDPSAMMETILAGDAFARQEISQEEYDAITKETRDLMRNFGGFALSGRGGDDLSDPLLANQLNSLLTPEQQKTLAELTARAAEAGEGDSQQMPLQGGNLPAMELEKLEVAMNNAQKFTTGLRSLMEGMQGMRDTFPEATTTPEK